jgi:predicted  nucleic acid-binding Zn-ribbon protein
MDAQHADVELDKAEVAITDAAGRRDEVFADLTTQETRAAARRQAMLPAFPEPLLALYNRVRAHKGTGAAMLQSRRCMACRLELDRSEVSRIKSAPADDIVQCENCDAILVRTPEAGL